MTKADHFDRLVLMLTFADVLLVGFGALLPGPFEFGVLGEHYPADGL